MDKYIGYVRVSNKEHDTSLPAQELKLKEYGQKHNIDLVKIYFEEKSAFKKSERHEFKRALKELEQEEVKGIVFHKVDRSARNMKDFALLEEFFDKKDIRVIEGEFDTSTAQGRFQFRIFCSMAVWYSENLSEEVTTKMTQRLREGYYPGNPPFGYRKGIKGRDKDWKKKYPDHNALYVKEIFEFYDTGNYSYQSLAKIMRKKGVTNTCGGKLKKSNVEKILSNPFYYGMIQWTRRATGKTEIFQGNHKPIISKKLFDRVAARREERTILKGSTGKLTYSRVFRCGCGNFLCPEMPTPKSKQRKYVYLRCRNKDCRFSSIREEQLEDLIVRELEKYKIKPAFFEEYRQAMKDFNSMIFEEINMERDEIHLRLTQIEAEKQKVRRGYIEEVFTAKDAKEMCTNLEKEEKSLLERLNTGKNKALNEAYFKTADHFFELFQNLSSKYKTATSEIKREVLNFFFANPTLVEGNLLLKPHPILEEVSIVVKVQNGWGHRPKPEIIKRIYDVYVKVKEFIDENNFVPVIERFHQSLV